MILEIPKIPAILALAIIIFFAVVPLLYSQEKASDWFQRGLNANTPESRIAAFERAVAIDPDYVEAYFYLGLAYRQKNMLTEAELTLHKAYFKNPYALNDEIKTRILFEMGVVKGSLKKNQEALDAFKGAKAIAGANNALKGRIQYELGLIYIQNGDYQLALQELREGRDLLPQSSDLFNKAMATAESNKSILDYYNNGVAFLNNSKYPQAIQQFEIVIRQNPNFKDVQEKLNDAKQSLSELNSNKRINDTYEQALAAKKKNDSQLAMSLFQQVAQDDPGFRDVANELRLLENRPPPTTRANRPANTADEDAERWYARGKTDLARQNFSGAVAALQQAQSIQSNYKDVDQLLLQARNGLRQQAAAEKKLENLYSEGMVFFAANDWNNALNRFREVQQMAPGYREVEQKIIELKQRVTAEKQTLASIDSLYQNGESAFQNEDWLNALLAFEKVEALKPGYKNAVQKISEAKHNLSNKVISNENPGSGRPNLVLITSGLLLCLLIPVAGVLIFSPTLKARMYLIKGDYPNAALILEKILEKRPEKIKLYPLLAHIYLLEDRQDGAALKTYEMVLKLNIMTPKRAQINSIVANYYLKSGKKDSNAIDIMEKELSYKMNKLQRGAAS